MANPLVSAATRAGLNFAEKVAGEGNRWGRFGALRSDFLSIDTPKAREAAINALTQSEDPELRRFGAALAEATGEPLSPAASTRRRTGG